MRRALTFLIVGLAVLAAGCGSSTKSKTSSTGAAATPSAPTTSTSAASTPSTGGAAAAPSAAGTTLHISASPSQLAFDVTALKAKTGTVTISMANPSSVPHGVAITGNGGGQSGQVVNQGGTSTVTVTLKPGTYTFYCPVPGHRQAGMQGTLTVT
jgi:plastocyanin